ncbi:MAG: acetate--CoA ligase family protein [Acetobacteraceae bacterium]
MSLFASLFAPERIALIGASADASRLTARAQIYLRRHGFSGTLYPINRHRRTVLGEAAFISLAEVPGPVDFAYVLLPTAQVAEAVGACAAARVPVVAVLADGFADAGSEGAARQREICTIARAGGVRLLGPNSMGMINVAGGIACSVNAVLEAASLPKGGLSLVSQSGGMMGTLLSRAAARGIGFARLIGTGNEADFAAGEIADLLVDDPETRVILLFLETIRDAGRMAVAARRAHARGKPVIVYKLGRSAAGARLAMTHTGALAGSDAAADAFFRASGILRVDCLETLFEVAPLAQVGPPKAARRAVRVVTTTGGGGAMIADRLGLQGVGIAGISDTTLAGARKETVAAALTAARNSDDADIVVAVIGSSAEFRPYEAVAGVIGADGVKPQVAFLAPEANASLRLLAEAGIAAFRTPESCADGVRAWLAWRAPRTAVQARDLSPIAKLLPAAGDEAGARAVFAALGIADGARLVDPDAPPPLEYPLALKAVAPGLAHKTEAGVVVLEIADAGQLARAARAMRTRLGPGVVRFLVQPMARGIAEVLVGFRRDPAVGPVVALGAGGVLAEIRADIVVSMAPVDKAEAEALIEGLACLRSARGYRGLPKGDLAGLARALVLVSGLAALPEVAEAEINPLIVMAEGEGVVMADALIRTAQVPP